MLSGETIDKVVDILVNRIEKTNLYVLTEIGESIKKIGTINPSKAQQLAQILKYGGNYEKIVKRIAKITQMNVNDIYKIFNEIAKEDYQFAKQFYDYRGINYIPYEENYAFQEQVRALATITAKEYLNLTKTSALGFGLLDKNGKVIFKGLKDTYYDILDEAVLSVSQGKETFDSAMYRQLKNIGESGLKVVYESGYNRRLDSAVRMNLESALGNLHNTIQQQIGEEFGADGVEISVHMNPALDHEEVQGKQFTYEQFNNLQTYGIATSYDGIQVNMYTGKSFRPISEWNCKHKTFSIVLGVNKPQYSNEKLKDIITKNNKGFDFEDNHYTMYEGTQLQRQIETEIRRKKEELQTIESGGFGANKTNAKIRLLKSKYRKLSKISGLPLMEERFKIA